jgi:endonuclease/exonuclease/phosphatase family metal-dependent hydrolase
MCLSFRKKVMRDNLIFAISLLLILSNAGCKKDKNTEGTFTVLTYNIAGLPEGISGSHPATYTPIISGLINEYDIVHVQEDFDYHDSLLLHNTHPYRTETMGTTTVGDGLNTLSRFPIKNFQRIKWNDCTDFDCFTPKGFSYSQIEIEKGVFIDFYNVHAQAQSYEEALEKRRKNIAQLCAYINEHSAGKAVIIMGDMNCRYTRTGDTIRAILDIGFEDVWIKLKRNGAIPEQNGNSLTNCTPDRSSANCEKVDKIFFRSNAQMELTALEYKLDDERYYYQGNDTLPLSDHWPLYAKFRFKISD